MVYTVDMVKTIDMLYTVDIVYTVDEIYTVDAVDNVSIIQTALHCGVKNIKIVNCKSHNQITDHVTVLISEQFLES